MIMSGVRPIAMVTAVFAVPVVPAPAAPPGPVTFTRSEAFGTGATIPVAWRDFDGDGDRDLAVGNYFNQVNELFVNEGGAFTRLTPFGAGNTFAVAWGDFDNDGDPDLAIGNNGQNFLAVNDGGTFVLEAQFGGLRSVAVAWADADGDGDLDLAVGNGILGVAQQNYLSVNDGAGGFTELARFGAGQTDSVAWADADGDGDLDLAVGNGGFNTEEDNRLYVNDGDATFVELARFGGGNTAVVAWADANGDGRPDLAVGNWNGGQSYLYTGNGDATYTEHAAFGTADTNTLAWGDADLDGDLDVAVGNGDFTTAGPNALFLNDGTGAFSEVPTFGLGSTDAVAWADVDGDGDLDLAVGNEHTPTQNELWTNDLAGGAFLRVRLAGRFHEHGAGYSNRDAIGASVGVYAAGHAGEAAHRRGVQWVSAHGGFAAQNDVALTFGIPANDAVDLVIGWPGSAGCAIVQRVFGVARGADVWIVERAPGDLDGDGVVAFADLLQLLGTWGPCPPVCDADLDGDGTVAFADLLVLLGAWGHPCPGA